MLLTKFLSASMVLFFLVGRINAQPQQPQGQKFSIGVKAAPTVTVARYRDRDLQKEFKPRPVLGYSLGGSIKFPLKNTYSFASEFAFSQKGRNTLFDNDGHNKGTYYMIDVSMALRRSFKFKLGKNIPADWYINVGPNIEYWLKGRGKLEYETGGSSKYEVRFNEERTANFYRYYYSDVNRWLFGIDIGVGGDAPLLKRQKIHAELRATLGQTQLGKKNSASFIELVPLPNDDLKASLKTLSLIFTYTLDFDLREAKKGKSTKDRENRRRK